MPFLTERSADNIGITITLLALGCIAILRANDSSSYIYILPLTIIIVCAILIIIWWQRWLTRTYLIRKRDEELKQLHQIVKEKDEYIAKIEQQNVTQGNLIHKDNKIIPAMEMAVTDFLKNYKTKDPEEVKEIANGLLDYLKTLSDGRKDILDSVDAEVKQLPRTGLTSIDALLLYLANKASKSDVTINMTVNANIKYLVQNIIEENDLNTLLAELVDNSIISAKQNEVKQLLINIELSNSIYVISIWDSGDTFASAVLKNFGIKSITTRGSTGGSGIGLVNISDVIKRYEASFIIDELLPADSIFSKKISVRFDRKSKYILRSNRTDISDILSSRSDIIIESSPK